MTTVYATSLPLSSKSNSSLNTINSMTMDQVEEKSMSAMLSCNPSLLRAYLPLKEHINTSSSLPPRYHELLILRIAFRTQSKHHWDQHLMRGEHVGLTSVEMAKVCQERASWQSRQDNIIIQCADDLYMNDAVNGKTKSIMIKMFGAEGLMDAIMTVNIYRALAALLRTFDTPAQ